MDILRGTVPTVAPRAGRKGGNMTRFDIWGNRKNLRSINGKVYLTEEQEQEFKEVGIIAEPGILTSREGTKIPYYISNGDLVSDIFQYHIPREDWGKTYNLVSEKAPEGGRNKVIYVPEKSRFEIWENHKGCKREMKLRTTDVSELISTWNELYEDDLTEDRLVENIK